MDALPRTRALLAACRDPQADVRHLAAGIDDLLEALDDTDLSMALLPIRSRHLQHDMAADNLDDAIFLAQRRYGDAPVTGSEYEWSDTAAAAYRSWSADREAAAANAAAEWREQMAGMLREIEGLLARAPMQVAA